jgi:hypothetical protein
MIGAIQNTGSAVEIISRVSSTPAYSEQQAASPPDGPPIVDQAMNLLESQEAAANAIVQAQVMIFKEGLEIVKNMAQQMLKMLNGSQLIARSASLPQQTETSLDVIA